MGTEPIITTPGIERHDSALSYSALAAYWELTKPEVNFLIVLTTFAGFFLGYLGQSNHFPITALIHTLLGTLLVASGAGTLNQFVERRFDARMRRTARRPIPSGRIAPASALHFGIFLSVAGAIYLGVAVNVFASLLALLTSAIYLFVYTPLKRVTPLCTLVGAVPGAMPPLIGWAAASGSLSPQAWILYVLLFLWQFPHFMAIAWIYREDYAQAGYLVLPVGARKGDFMAWHTVIPLTSLLPLTLIPMVTGRSGLVSIVGNLILTFAFLYGGAELAVRRSNLDARRLLFASIIYLPLVLALMVFDKS